MRPIKNLMKDKKGDMVIFLCVLVVSTFGLAMLVTEYQKAFGMEDYLETELNRAVNISIKQAMYDSYRQDYSNKLNPSVAKKVFNDYLKQNMGLNDNLEKFSDHSRTHEYQIKIKDMQIDGENATMQVEAVAYLPTIFKGLPEWKLPMNVKSRSMRVDGR